MSTEDKDLPLSDTAGFDELADLLNTGRNLPSSRESNIEDYPDRLLILPLTRRCFMPSMSAPVIIEKGPYYDMLKEVAKMDHKFIGLVLTKDENQDIYEIDFDDMHKVGVVARILRIINIVEAGAQVILNMERRFKITNPVATKKKKPLVAKVSYHQEKVPRNKRDVIKAYSSTIVKIIRELITHNPVYKEELQLFIANSDFAAPWKLADFAVALTTASREDLQDILSTFDLVKRMEKATVLLKKELEISRLQLSINQNIETTITNTQREFFLKEQLKAIKKELGLNKDDKTVDCEKFEERLKEIKLSTEAQKVFDEEIEKLNVLDPQSAEYGVVRSYLDWLTCLPWSVFDEENNSLASATKILEKDHYGLKEIKERILEYISVAVLKNSTTKGYIICLVGPPGVGKTSVGKSIARALGRKFYRFSVGGLKDEAEIKGHRRTYVGAMPGKVIQALKYTQSSNPVIMLDEIDKIGTGFQGDPASALLEVLDPEQNGDFLDHYLDVRYDLSNILFIVTANTLDTIPSALRDRLEVLRLSGYIEEEKVQISKKYLIPRHRKECGLKATDIEFKPDALKALISGYCRESGVRQLEKMIKKVLRKVATEKVKALESKKKAAAKKKVEVTTANLEKYLGKPIFTSERYYHKGVTNGVATGLAYTEYGGSILYIETVINKGKDKLILTGNTGSIMTESSKIAYTYMLSKRVDYLPEGFDFEGQEIHVHVPEGATPKDGPSAGITMVTSMISLLTDRPVPTDLGMTGEITLTGKVLPIGGVKEKVLAAKREGLKTVIMPKRNKRDYEELATYIKKGLAVHFVEDYCEVHDIVFSGKKPKKAAAAGPKRRARGR